MITEKLIGSIPYQLFYLFNCLKMIIPRLTFGEKQRRFTLPRINGQ